MSKRNRPSWEIDTEVDGWTIIRLYGNKPEFDQVIYVPPGIAVTIKAVVDE